MALPYVLQRLIDLANGKADIGHSHPDKADIGHTHTSVAQLPNNITFKKSLKDVPMGISLQCAHLTDWKAAGEVLPPPLLI